VDWQIVSAEELAVQAGLLRDIFGSPFRPVVPDEAWRTPEVVKRAQPVYDSQDLNALPILADALEEAGGDHPDILAHLRGPGPHVRGCWALDLLLGRN
jgi:hypothetical protein